MLQIYCVMQQNEASTADVRENLLEMDRKINEKTLQLKEISNKLKSNTAEVAEMKGKITLAEALNQKLRLEKEMGDVKNDLEKYSSVETVSPKIKNAADKNYEDMMTVYKKRKRICMDILNSILENYPKSKKHLFEEIGIETDEEAGFCVDTL